MDIWSGRLISKCLHSYAVEPGLSQAPPVPSGSAMLVSYILSAYIHLKINFQTELAHPLAPGTPRIDAEVFLPLRFSMVYHLPMHACLLSAFITVSENANQASITALNPGGTGVRCS